MLQCNMAGASFVRLHRPQSPNPSASASSAPGVDAIHAGWRRWFDAWESSTARLAEQTLRQSWLLEPSGMLLSGAMRFKALTDRMTEAWLGALGLSTRSAQLRMQHEINTLQSRLLDLQERLDDPGQGTP
jgi:hypothetical protein